ncbi:oligopeptide transporter permease [Psittacicella melopsittaci]|uniref:Oligopeptide transporter permease n=1 Tax=Psittacicella melopsittaci TaxID=2028576 RepID=A0A3A1Y3U7_9GAMM|nr:oligopeptide ABC transporter permease OppB [Psittacicella melopsittaci]RIY31926.1 oligopeptide transporter permease [Psittacicella melopsittaci]
MYKYIFRRILEAIPTLLILIAITFFLMRLAPGSPFTSERAYPPEIIANIEAKYHLNEPMWKQFLIYLNSLLHGDLGPSFKYKDFTVNQLVGQSFGASLKLGSISFLIVLALGITVGIIAALYQNTWIDYSVISLLVVGSVIPTIVAAPVLIYIFAVKLGWLPSGGWNGGALRNMILPIIIYVYGSMTFLARITRGNMIEVLTNNYIRTARAKGLSTRYIIVHHALRAVSVPVVQVLTLSFVGFITGSIIVEQIFGIPGLGQLYVQGATNRDYGLVLSITILSGVLIVLANIVNDILMAVVDPRIKF